MPEPDADPADLAALYGALTLAERAAARPDPPPAEEISDAARHRLEQWRALSPFQADGWLARRLAADGLDEGSFARWLAAPAAAAGERLAERPAWLRELAEGLAALAAPGSPPTDAEPLPLPEPLRGDPTFGFLALVSPWVERARRRLHAGILDLARRGGAPFAPAAVERELAAALPLDLMGILARTLVLEMHVARLRGDLAGEAPAERFAAFVARLRRPEVAAALLSEYPVLARQAAQRLDLWVAASLELCGRLAADWPLLVATFFGGVSPGDLAAVDGGAGDRHRGGRAVHVLTFASGAKLVYKPRPLAADAHFQELLAWLNAAAAVPPLATVRVLDRGAYGWMEHVAAAGCAARAEVALYHRRLGGLLALLYAVEATDCHFENLIAAGDQPVVVDLESLFHPRVPRPQPPRADERLAQSAILDSVLRVGLLPFRIGESDEFAGVDVSGVAAVAGQPSPQPVLQWAGLGTDEMRAVRERVPLAGARNLPRLDGREIEAAFFADDMAAGFAAVYRALAARREELLAPGGPLARFAGDPVRAVLRPTQLYSLLLAESFHPDVLRDALDRDLLFDRLWVGIAEQPELARVIPAEHRDLTAGDVPAFTTYPATVDLWTSRGERIAGFFAETPFAAVRRRLEGMGEADLERQLDLLRLSLGTQLLNRDDVAWDGYAPVDPGPQLPAEALRERLLAAARDAAAWIAARALRGEGYTTWIGLDFRQQRWSLAPLPADLYAGLPGIALFLGYLGEVTGQARWTTLAREAAVSLRGHAEAGGDAAAQGPPTIGAFQGWGGLLYALSHLGALWGDGELLAAAAAIPARIAARLAADEDLDVVGGAAGAIFALLALHAASGSPQALAVAVRCGEHLLARAEPAGPGLAWRTRLSGDRPQIGFSHGAAGIGLALLQLGAAAGEPRFTAAGLAALTWERDAFWPELERWLDRREGEPPPLESTVAMAWCYGAPGIGLSRLLALRSVADGEARQQLEEEADRALRLTVERGFGQNHCLCHGDLGNLDLLLTAWRGKGDAALGAAVDRQTRAVLASLARDGFRCGARGGVQSPGLMNGMAGIGYGLLRLAAPDRVPSVLALAPPGR